MTKMGIKRHATIKEIAHAARVGLTTVDRVIHSRPGVRPEKIERVLRTIEKLNRAHTINGPRMA
jgi:DNA-binding LacI/PurR family transcriptional regulator